MYTCIIFSHTVSWYINLLQSSLLGFKTAFYYITSKHLLCVDFKYGSEASSTILPPLPVGFRYAELAMDDETHLLAISSTKKTDSKDKVQRSNFKIDVIRHLRNICLLRSSWFKIMIHDSNYNSSMIERQQFMMINIITDPTRICTQFG